MIWFRGDEGVVVFVDDFAVEDGHLAVDVFEFFGGDGVEVAVPDCDVGSFAGLEGADFVFEEEKRRGPRGVRTQGGVNVDGFGDSEGLGSGEGFAFDRCPEAVARGIGGDVVVGASAPADAVVEVGLRGMVRGRRSGRGWPREFCRATRGRAVAVRGSRRRTAFRGLPWW